jgi:hypothetical protein
MNPTETTQAKMATNYTLTITRTVVMRTTSSAEMTYEEFSKMKMMKDYTDEEKLMYWATIVEENMGELDLGEDEDEEDEECDWKDFLQYVKNETHRVIKAFEMDEEREKARQEEITKEKARQEEITKLKARLAELNA